MKHPLIGRTWSSSMNDYKVIDKFRDYFTVERTDKKGFKSQQSVSRSDLLKKLQ